MIRPAKHSDIFPLGAILEASCARSRYAGLGAVDMKAARTMLAMGLQRHGGTTEGGTFLMVHETDGKVDAFVLASIGRIYGVLDIYCTNDHYLLGLEDCAPRALAKLFRAYVEWAERIPRVYEIGASWADTISPDGRGVTRMFERAGFTLCGKQYRRERVQSMEIAA